MRGQAVVEQEIITAQHKMTRVLGDSIRIIEQVLVLLLPINCSSICCLPPGVLPILISH